MNAMKNWSAIIGSFSSIYFYFYSCSIFFVWLTYSFRVIFHLFFSLYLYFSILLFFSSLSSFLFLSLFSFLFLFSFSFFFLLVVTFKRDGSSIESGNQRHLPIEQNILQYHTMINSIG